MARNEEKEKEKAGSGLLRTLARRRGQEPAPPERRRPVVTGEAEASDPVELASEHSFPASDPPAWIYMNR